MGLVPFIKQIKAMAQDCELLENYLDRTKWSHRKLQHDSQMGGSLLVAGKEKVGKRAKARYTHYQRGFVCVRETGEPIILVDALQHHLGPDFRTLKLWRGGTFRPGTTEELIDENRMYEMYASVGAMMYLARKLDIRYIAMRDQPVNEFARALGMPERAIFKKSQDHWKIGLHSEKKWTGVHTNAIYRSGTGGPDGKKQLRYRTIEMFPFGNTSEMFTELERRAKDIIESNRGKARKAHRTSEKLEALTALYIIIQDFPLTSADARHRAYGIMQQAYRTLKQDVPTTVLFEPHAS